MVKFGQARTPLNSFHTVIFLRRVDFVDNKGGAGRQRHSAGDGIVKQAVADLGVVWEHMSGTSGGHRANRTLGQQSEPGCLTHIQAHTHRHRRDVRQASSDF